MKYKLEVWKYGVFDCIDGGDHLNKMLKKGWQYYGRIGDIAIYKKQKGDLNIKYCIDVFFTNDEKKQKNMRQCLRMRAGLYTPAMIKAGNEYLQE